MIAPINRTVGGDAARSEGLLGGMEICRADVKGMMSLAQRVFNAVGNSLREVGAFEQGKHLFATAQQYLMTAEALRDLQTQDCGVKALGTIEVGNV